jgi:phospholipid/cholesterol/gamma-HCH transport system ATP-binding protein
MTTPNGSAIIRVEDLRQHFPMGDQVVRALDGINLSVAEGEFFGISGPSGSGKSTLMYLLGGLDHPTEGRIWVAGQEITQLDEDQLAEYRRKTIGFVFQMFNLIPSMTALENVEFPMREHLDVSDRLRREVATAKLEMVGLTAADGAKLPSQLSGGMTKRVALARALALDPEIVFLDEPTSGLDPIAASEFDALIKTLQGTLGLTVFMVTHDLESLYTIANRIAVLADGKVVADGPISAMLASEHPWVKSYFRGKRARLLAERLAQAVG